MSISIRAIDRGLAGIAAWVTIVFSASSLAAAPPSKKTERYYGILLKRPQSELVLDRFIDSWLENGTLDELEEFLKKRAASGSAVEWQALARYQIDRGERKAAMDSFNRALEIAPDNPGLLLARANLQAQALNFDAAINDLGKAQEGGKASDEQKVEAGKLLGICYARAGQLSKARESWKAVLESLPEDMELREDLIELYEAEGLFPDALKLVQDLVERTKDPYDRVLRKLRMASILESSGDQEEMLKTYRAVLEDVGQGSWLEREILGRLSTSYQKQGDVTGLKEEYEKLAERYPQRLALQKQLAFTLAAVGEKDDAVERFRQILKVTPGDRATLEEFISLLRRADRKEEAAEELRKLVEREKEARLFENLATLYFEIGKQELATKALDQALALGEKREADYLRIASALGRGGAKVRQRELLRETVAAFADSLSPKEALAERLYDDGEKEEALALWRKSAKGADEHGVLRAANGIASVGELEAAFELLWSRHQEFPRKVLFLHRICELARMTRHYEEGMASGRDLIVMAESPTDLARAVQVTVSLIVDAKQIEQQIEELEEGGEAGIGIKCLLAELYDVSGRRADADRTLEEEVAGGSELAIMQQTRLLERREQFVEAAQTLEPLIEQRQGGRSVLLRRLVDLYSRAGKGEEALKWIAEWKKLSRGAVEPMLVESRLLANAGRYDEATNKLEFASRKFKERAELTKRLAELYAEQGRELDARRIFRRMLEGEKERDKRLAILQQMAELAQRGEGVGELVHEFEARRRTNPNSLEPLLALELLHRVADNYQDQRRALLAASRLRPDDPSILLKLAAIEQREFDFESARKTLERILEKNPESPDALKAMVSLCQDAGYPERAVDYAIRAVGGIEQMTLRDGIELAGRLLEQSRLEQAAKFLAQLALVHDDPVVDFARAIVAEEAGEVDSAARLFRRIVREAQDSQMQPAGPQGGRMAAFLGVFENQIPRTVIQVLEAFTERMSVYAYRGGAMGLGGGAPRHAFLMSVPTEAERMKRWALVHLATLLGDQAERLAEIEKEAEDQGVLLPRIWLQPVAADGPNMQRWQQERGKVRDEVLKMSRESPEDVDLAALALMMDSEAERTMEVEEFTARIELLAPDYPELSVLLFAQRLSQGVGGGDVGGVGAESNSKRLLSYLKEVREPFSPLLVTSYGTLSNLDWLESEGIKMAHLKQLSAIMQAWLDKENVEADMKKLSRLFTSFNLGGASNIKLSPVAMLGPSLCMIYQQQGDWDQTVKLLNRACVAGQGGGLQQILGARFGGSWGESTPLPKYPPTQLESLPSWIMDGLGLEEDDGISFGEEVEVRLSLSELLKRVDQIRPPALKALLYALGDQHEDCEKVVKDWAAQEFSPKDAFTFLAAVEVRGENWLAALGALERMRGLALSKDERSELDWKILHLALKAHEKAELKGEILERAQATARRVWRAAGRPVGASGALNIAAMMGHAQQERGEVAVKAMEKLGMKQDLERARKSLQQQASAGGGLAGRRTSPLDLDDRIEKRMKKKDMDGAVRELAMHFRRMAQRGRHDSWELRQILSEHEELKKPLLEELKVGEDASPRQLKFYADAQLFLQEYEGALKSIEFYLAKNDRDQATKITRVILLAVTGREKKAKASLAASEIPIARIGEGLAEFLDDNFVSFKEEALMGMLQLARWLIEPALTDEHSPLPEDWLWMTHLVAEVVDSRMNSLGGGSYSSIRGFLDPAERPSGTSGEKLDAEILELLKTMLPHYYLNSLAFRVGYQHGHVREKDAAWKREWIAEALRGLAASTMPDEDAKKAWRKENPSIPGGGMAGHVSSGRETVVVFGTVEQAVLFGAESDDVEALWFQEYLKAREDLVRRAEAFASLSNTPAESLQKKIGEYQELTEDDAKPFGSYEFSGFSDDWQEAAIMHVLLQREDAEKTLTDYLKQSVQTSLETEPDNPFASNSEVFLSQVNSWLPTLAERMSHSELDEFLAELFDMILPKGGELRKQFFRLRDPSAMYGRLSGRRMTKDFRRRALALAFVQMLNQARDDYRKIDLLFIGCRRLVALHGEATTDVSRKMLFGGDDVVPSNLKYFAQRGEMAKALPKWGVTGEPKEMDPILLPENEQALTLLGAFLKEGSIASNLKPQLQEKKDFGSRLVLNLITKAPVKNTVDLLNKKSDDLMALEERQRLAILGLLECVKGGPQIPENLDPRLRKEAKKVLKLD